ncbi:MAG: aminotransferase class V-fold PLP-dependent enzyme [Phycisphaerales bacterium]|nr:aminotransferase class V-fold PLP-dependent enzyme [Planctomycetota bacterium]MCH8508304.1 aminotransferase class V-fold PLP-dependent enzyme [Phycisphaerales bacterium]
MPTIQQAAANLPQGPLTEAALVEHIHPLFTRTLARTDEIYLANHSLGRPLDQTADDVREALDLWYTDMDAAWEAWLGERDAYRARMGRLIGRADPKAVVPKTSAAQGLRAVINSLPRRTPNIIATRGEFDSIDFVLKAYAHRGRARLSWVACEQNARFDADRIIEAVKPGADLVVISRVFFATGQILEDIERVIAHAHDIGARVLVDAYHSAGVLPESMDDLGCDAMIGGNYKYTRAGAGACWLALADTMLRDAPTPDPEDPAPIDTGWFAKAEPFAYHRTELPEYAPRADAWLEATPPVLTYYQARTGLDLALALGVDRLRDYSLRQLAFLRDALHESGVTTRLINPRPDQHGAYLLIPVADGKQAVTKLKHAGLNTDARPSPAGANNTNPEWFVRLCPDILNTESELTQAARITAQTLERR